MIFEEEFPSLTAGLYNIDKIGVEACCLDKERVREYGLFLMGMWLWFVIWATIQLG